MIGISWNCCRVYKVYTCLWLSNCTW